MAELKPCPFCGGKPYIQKSLDVARNKFYSVKCHCGVLIHFQDKQYKAVEIWNRRVGESVG